MSLAEGRHALVVRDHRAGKLDGRSNEESIRRVAVLEALGR
jgi:hypothetical protein